MLFFMLGLLSSGPAGMVLKSGYHPAGPGDFSFGNLRVLEVRSPGGVAAGTGGLVRRYGLAGSKRKAPVLLTQGLFDGRFSRAARGPAVRSVSGAWMPSVG